MYLHSFFAPYLSISMLSTENSSHIWMTSFFVLPVASHISSSFLIKSRGNLAETTAVSPVYFFEDITNFFSANVNTSFNQILKTKYTYYVVLQKSTLFALFIIYTKHFKIDCKFVYVILYDFSNTYCYFITFYYRNNTIRSEKCRKHLQNFRL